VDQYQALLAAPSGLEGIDKADLEYYEAAVASSSGVDLDEPYLPPKSLALFDTTSDGADFDSSLLTASDAVDIERYQHYMKEKTELEDLYGNYVGRPEKMTRGIGGGGSRAGSSLADPYERWLRGFEA
jgi:hypothetical protein